MGMFGTWLDKFMDMTAWEMAKPTAYGTFHLTFTFVGILLCIVAAWLLRNTGERGNRRLLLGIGVFLMLTEIYKQLFYYYHIGNGSYQWWIFPFQMCSIPMYFCVISAFLKTGRIKWGIYNFMTTFNLLGGIMAFIEPSGIVHNYWTLTIHAFVWHMTLIFIGVYLIASKRCATTMRDFRLAVVTFVVLCAIAFGINLLLRDVSNGSVNMFFVGPADSSLAVFKDISKNYGWYISTLLYIPAVCIGAFLIFLPVHLVAKKKLAMAK